MPGSSLMLLVTRVKFELILYDFPLETPQLLKLQGLAANSRHERQGGGENGVKIPFSLNSTHAILIK